MMIFVGSFIFAAALLGAGYYVWSVPQQQENQALAARLREIRSRAGGRTRAGSPDLFRREQRGGIALPKSRPCVSSCF
jgi:hypothetical protein